MQARSGLVSLLFLPGYAFGRIAGRRPLWTGLGMVLLGGALVGLTIALGGSSAPLAYGFGSSRKTLCF